MTHHRPDHDAENRRHTDPSPVVEPGEIDGGVTPQHELGKHPAQDIENQHDLETDILPVDATATRRPRPTEEKRT